MAVAVKRLGLEELGQTPKRLRGSPLREVHNNENMGFTPKPAGWHDNLAELQRAFPKVHVGIVSSILESSANMADAARALCRISPEQPTPVQLDFAPRTRKRRGADISMESEPKRGCTDESMEPGAAPQDVASWGERLVASLQGVQSVEHAKQITHQALSAFADHVRKEAAEPEASEPEPASEEPEEDRTTSVANANKVLFKALKMLNDKNQVLQRKGDEADSLRQQLADAKASLSKAEASNQVLQWHLQQASMASNPLSCSRDIY